MINSLYALVEFLFPETVWSAVRRFDQYLFPAPRHNCEALGDSDDAVDIGFIGARQIGGGHEISAGRRS